MKGGCERAAHWSAFVHGLVALPSSFLWWLEKESSLGQKKENSSFFLSLYFSWLYHPWKGSDIYMFLAVGLSLVQILWANKYFSQRPYCTVTRTILACLFVRSNDFYPLLLSSGPCKVVFSGCLKMHKKASRIKYNHSLHLLITSTLDLFSSVTPPRIAQTRKVLFWASSDA